MKAVFHLKCQMICQKSF